MYANGSFVVHWTRRPPYVGQPTLFQFSSHMTNFAMVNKQNVHIEAVLLPTSHVSAALVSHWLEKRLSSGVSVFQNGSLPPACYASTATDTAEHQSISSSILRVSVVDLLPNTAVSFWRVCVV